MRTRTATGAELLEAAFSLYLEGPLAAARVKEEKAQGLYEQWESVMEGLDIEKVREIEEVYMDRVLYAERSFYKKGLHDGFKLAEELRKTR